MSHETPRPRANAAHARQRDPATEITNARASPIPFSTQLRLLARRRDGGRALCVGVDVVSVAEVAAALRQFGNRYVRRVFTADEADYCLAAADTVSAARLAVRFAAKEAVVKALEPDGPWSDWRAIEVRRHRSGRSTLVLHGKAASLAARRRIQHLALSMSHDGGVAAAIVIGLRAPTRKGEHRHA